MVLRLVTFVTFRVLTIDQVSANTRRLQARVLNHARSLSWSLTVAYLAGGACNCPPPLQPTLSFYDGSFCCFIHVYLPDHQNLGIH